MKLYKWTGTGHYLGATMIVLADKKADAKEIISKELIDTGLAKSWEESEYVEEIELNETKLIYADNGDY